MTTDFVDLPEINEADPFATSEQSTTFTLDPLIEELSDDTGEVGEEIDFEPFEGQEQAQGETQQAEPEPEPVKIPATDFSVYKNSAIGVVDTLDSVAQTFLPNRAKRTFFSSREELERARQLKISYDRGNQIESHEIELVDAYDAWVDYCHNVPMSQPTKESIIQPLAEVLAKRSTVVTPETRLLLALAIWALPLILPLFNSKK